MRYAQTLDGETVGRVRNRPPASARRLDDGRWVTGLTADTPADLLAAVGVFPVTDTARPTDPDHLYTATYTLDGGAVVESWVQGEDISARNAAESQRQQKRSDYRGAIATLRQWEADAAAVTVTQANAIQVLQAVVNRVGILSGGLADLIEAEFPG